MPTRLTIQVPPDFELFKAVCSYGHFLLAPNHWDRDKQVLHRPIKDTKQRNVRTRITQSSQGKPVAIYCDRQLARNDQQHLKTQVIRVLRIDEDVSPWYKLHAKAKRRGFGRLFRSPTLFEDMLKTITSCNVTWTGTLMMNRLMVEHIGHGGFPTPEQVADFGEQRLKERCKVGYRAGRIAQLARSIVDGELDLSWFEHEERSSDETYEALLKLHGIGPYAAANINMLLGHYDRIAIDTETYRHFCLSQKITRPKDAKKLHRRIERYYDQWSPYQFVAYWFELWRDYESRFGPSHRWDREKDAKQFTAAALNE